MHQLRHRKLTSLAFCLLLSFVGMAMAGVSGKIVGTVKDAKSGDPVPGASVVIEGVRMGATTDSDGRYFILNVPAGRYTLKSQLIGYTPTVSSNVLVRADLTTRINFSLSSQALEVDQITVIAEAPLIQRTRTSTRRTTLKEQLAYMPVTTSDGVYRSAPGVVFDEIGGPPSQVSDGTIRTESETRSGNTANPGLSIRGSRTAEVNYYLDNIPVMDPVGHSNAFVLPGAAIEETDVKPGGFEASYGNGTSIVNTVTTSPGAKLDLAVKWESDLLPGLIKERYDYGANIVTTTIGGAIPGTDNRLRIWAMGNINQSDDWGPKLHPEDAEYIESSIEEFTGRANMDADVKTFWADKKPWDVFEGESLVLPNHTSDQYSGLVKMIYSAGPIQFRASSFTWRRQYGRFAINSLFTQWDDTGSRGLDAITDVQLSTFEDRQQFNLALSWAATPKTIFEAKASYATRQFILASKDVTKGEDGLFDDFDYPWTVNAKEWSPFYSADGVANGTDANRTAFLQRRNEVYYPLGVPNLFYTSGNSRGTNAREVNELTFQLDATSQITNSHEMKAGVEVIQYEVKQDRMSDPWDATPFYDQWGPFKPVYAAAHIQDKIEYEGMTVTLGGRFDYFDADAKAWTDPLKPGAGSLMPDGTVNTAGRSDLDGDPTGDGYRDVDVDAKTAFSPRIGISHPVSDKALLYFNYGHFRTVQTMATLYESYAPDLNRSNTRIGNPDLPMLKTISYEIGYTQEMAANTKLDVVLYYKNMTNLPTYERVPAIGGAYTYAAATSETMVGDETANVGYGRARGAEFMLTKFRGNDGYLSGWLSYSYMRATTIYSDANDAYERFSRSALDPQTGELANPPDIPATADFDRTHAIRASLDLRLPTGFGPTIAGMRPLQNSGLNVLQSANAGLPYTRTDYDGDPIGETNEFTKPWTFETNLTVNKDFLFGQTKASVYCKVTNLFDRRNIQEVYPRTGNSTDDGKRFGQAQPNTIDPTSANWIYEGVKDGIDGSTPDGAISIAEDELAYQMAYQLFSRDPLFYMSPRVIRVGLALSF
jgi:hypothetical protein